MGKERNWNNKFFVRFLSIPIFMYLCCVLRYTVSVFLVGYFMYLLVFVYSDRLLFLITINDNFLLVFLAVFYDTCINTKSNADVGF